jgi:23S rRNA 5-hydroxycytidine C2501 synthase
MQPIELLAPARDVAAAEAAMLCGADAVYIGAPRFSARQAAGNSLDDIARVIAMARPYRVRVYAALNTLLFDDELAQAATLIRGLYGLGIDGLIIQDVGLLELDLPPVPLIASTQMHNNAPEKVKFLEDVGFSRVILARELTLDQIAAIRRQTTVELECFIHGALCVSHSGRCAMSYALGKRSGNRGQCAQPCRRPYTLKTLDGKTLVKDRYLLSLKDLNLSDRLEALLDAGITSFKIEGRLKEAPYVANTVGFYRQKLDTLLKKKHLKKSSSGTAALHFTPDPQKTFNRGFTEYGLIQKDDPMESADTPKSIGQPVGSVRSVDRQSFVLDGDVELHNADGLCFFDAHRNLCGTVVNRVEGRRIFPQSINGIRPGTTIYRNFDRQFLKSLECRFAERTIALRMTLTETADGLQLSGIDEDGVEAAFAMPLDKQPAEQPDAARHRIGGQLKKLGNTLFTCTDIQLDTKTIYFLPVSTINALKRGLIQRLTELRQAARSLPKGGVIRNDVPYPEKILTWHDNVLNEKAAAFYRRHGVERMEPAAESGLDLPGQTVMTTKYCLRRQLGLCEPNAAPLVLEDEDGRRFRLRFLCGPCGMEIDWITPAQKDT